jgi:ribosomal protein S18 acetylase RimI-like enzyme
MSTRSRGPAVGRALIDWLWAQTRANNWSRLYWHTRENNYRARALYDTYTPHSGFLRYVLANGGGDGETAAPEGI